MRSALIVFILVLPGCFSPDGEDSTILPTTSGVPTSGTTGTTGSTTSGASGSSPTDGLSETTTGTAPTSGITSSTSTTTSSTTDPTSSTGAPLGCGDGILTPPEECDSDPGCGPDCMMDRLVFVSSVTVTGALGGVTGADLLCNQLAASAGIVVEGKFWAWLGQYVGGVETSPATHIPFLPGRYVLVTGDVIVNAFEDLYLEGAETILHPIDRTELGMEFHERVWTNVREQDGKIYTQTPSEHCQGWDSASPRDYGVQGFSSITDAWWTHYLQGSNCASSARIYCFEGGKFEL